MEISKFVVHNWYLFAGLVFVVAMLLWEPLRRVKYRYNYVAPAQAVIAINRENPVILDIRAPKEFQDGHIVNSQNIPYMEFDKRVSDLDKYKGRPVIVVCRNGQLSPKGAATLRKRELQDVRVLSGGINAWLKAQLPVEK